jgi:hypothetical protein
MNIDRFPILAVAILLAVSGLYHLLAPQSSEALLSRPKPVRLVGAVLCGLGAWCVLSETPGRLPVGLPVFISGVGRLLFPERSIRLNTWTSRHVHGALMLIGALLCGLFLAA